MTNLRSAFASVALVLVASASSVACGQIQPPIGPSENPPVNPPSAVNSITIDNVTPGDGAELRYSGSPNPEAKLTYTRASTQGVMRLWACLGRTMDTFIRTSCRATNAGNLRETVSLAPELTIQDTEFSETAFVHAFINAGDLVQTGAGAPPSPKEMRFEDILSPVLVRAESREVRWSWKPKN